MRTSDKSAITYPVLLTILKLKRVSVCAVLMCLCGYITNAQTIMTVAGNGGAGYTGDGVPATSTTLDQPLGVAIDNTRNIYIADFTNKRIRKVNTAGIISTIAGNGLSAGPRGDDGPATNARLFVVEDVAVNKATGDIYICDYGDRRIRKVSTSGIITTIAGTDGLTPGGDGGPATLATFDRPGSIAIDALGNIYIGDQTNFRIRKINTAGIMSTYAGTGTSGHSGDGGPATAAQFSTPVAMELDGAGNLYVADLYNHVIRKISASGIISTIAGTPSVPGYTGDGGPAISAQLRYPRGIAIDAAGNIFITDSGNGVIRKIEASGKISTYAGTTVAGFSGNGSPATVAQLNGPAHIEVDNYGDLYIADVSNNRIRKVFDVVTISISPSYTVCPGVSVTLTATIDAGCGIATYEWYKNGSIASSGGGSYTYVPANGDAVYCKVTTSGGTCAPGITASSNTITVTVSPWVTTSGASTCIGQTTTLTGTPSGGTWSTEAAGIATVSGTGVVTGIAAGTAEITYSLGASCYATATVSVGAAPSAGSITGPGNVCAGKSITLTNAVTGGTWSSSGGATIGATGVVTGVTAGTATITYTVSNTYCTATTTVNVTVHPSPDAGAITAPANVCPGANFTLSNTVAGGTWISSNSGVANIDGATGSTNSIAIGTTIISYLVGPNVNGCSAATAVTVNVIANSVTLSGNVTDADCYGDSTGTITLATAPADSVYSYTWSTGDTAATANGLPKGSYSVVVTQQSTQCKRSAQYAINSPDSMTAYITAFDRVCDSGGYLKAEVTGGVMGYQFLWKSDSATYTTAEVLQPDSATYTLTVTDAKGCKKEWIQQIRWGNCPSVFVLSALSPNGDGINDKWIIGNIKNYPSNTVQVFDKWGNIVYEQTGYEGDDWDGTKANGGQLPDGTYYYLVKLNEANKAGGLSIFKGFVTLKR